MISIYVVSNKEKEIMTSKVMRWVAIATLGVVLSASVFGADRKTSDMGEVKISNKNREQEVRGQDSIKSDPLEHKLRSQMG